MNELTNAITDWEWLIDIIKTIAAFGGALLVIKGWLIKPIAGVRTEVEKLKSDIADNDKRRDEKSDDFMSSQKSLMHDLRERQMNQDYVLNFLVSDRLSTAHDYWMRKGYCPEPDRSRLKEMYSAHRMRGQNHLAESFLDDIDNLPKTNGGEKL